MRKVLGQAKSGIRESERETERETETEREGVLEEGKQTEENRLNVQM